MGKQYHALSLNDEIGDKIRIRTGPYASQRGIVTEIYDSELIIELASGVVIRVENTIITNYSLAARRAWKNMPKRAGRPKDAIPRKRMVSLRIDRDIWDRLGAAVEQGIISSREQAINDWVRESLDNLILEPR